jgi:hypothetical protein
VYPSGYCRGSCLGVRRMANASASRIVTRQARPGTDELGGYGARVQLATRSPSTSQRPVPLSGCQELPSARRRVVAFRSSATPSRVAFRSLCFELPGVTCALMGRLWSTARLIELARKINLQRHRCDLPRYSPRFVQQQALYVFRSRSNRTRHGNPCANAVCSVCPSRTCPFAARHE